MIERAARALAGWPPNVTSWEDVCDQPKDAKTLQEIYHTQVRAVIGEFREPSEAMIDAGMGALSERGCNPLTGDADACFQAMIDAALSE